MFLKSGQAAVRNWLTVDPVAHIRGVQLRNDRIRVNNSGLYYLYSQVYFLSLYFGGNSPGATTLYHYVYRYNVIYPNGGEELLLKSVRTQCWERNKEYDDYTSFTGGVFRLNVGDEIYVKVSNISQVSQDPKATFFGMFKLGWTECSVVAIKLADLSLSLNMVFPKKNQVTIPKVIRYWSRWGNLCLPMLLQRTILGKLSGINTQTVWGLCFTPSFSHPNNRNVYVYIQNMHFGRP